MLSARCLLCAAVWCSTCFSLFQPASDALDGSSLFACAAMFCLLDIIRHSIIHHQAAANQAAGVEGEVGGGTGQATFQPNQRNPTAHWACSAASQECTCTQMP
jgi:hypothetical protein